MQSNYDRCYVTSCFSKPGMRAAKVSATAGLHGPGWLSANTVRHVHALLPGATSCVLLLDKLRQHAAQVSCGAPRGARNSRASARQCGADRALRLCYSQTTALRAPHFSLLSLERGLARRCRHHHCHLQEQASGCLSWTRALARALRHRRHHRSHRHLMAPEPLHLSWRRVLESVLCHRPAQCFTVSDWGSVLVKQHITNHIHCGQSVHHVVAILHSAHVHLNGAFAWGQYGHRVHAHAAFQCRTLRSEFSQTPEIPFIFVMTSQDCLVGNG